MHRAAKWGRFGLAGALALGTVGCVTTAEFRKVERRVIDLERAKGGASADPARLAELGAEVESLRSSIDAMQGRLEVAEHRLAQALEEARAARAAAAGAAVGAAETTEGGEEPEDAALSEEVSQYRAAYASWRSGDVATCIDRFKGFLQTYPSSDYADDAMYWLGDCHYKQGELRTAVLRFDAVANQYPGGNKAPDALFRQGEVLLELGHATAAGTAFEKVIEQYPDSARAPEARRQLEVLRAG